MKLSALSWSCLNVVHFLILSIEFNQKFLLKFSSFMGGGSYNRKDRFDSNLPVHFHSKHFRLASSVSLK